jgi:hypothetical protein
MQTENRITVKTLFKVSKAEACTMAKIDYTVAQLIKCKKLPQENKVRQTSEGVRSTKATRR